MQKMLPPPALGGGNDMINIVVLTMKCPFYNQVKISTIKLGKSIESR